MGAAQSSEKWYLTTSLHGVTTQKAMNLIKRNLNGDEAAKGP